MLENFDPAKSFGRGTSKRYFSDGSGLGDEAATVAFLAGLAAEGGGDALEFAVGTGRITLPLAEAGVLVEGIELSQDMIDRMRERPGGDAVKVAIGDMSRVDMGRSYGLVYLVFNTIGNLITQDDQVRCFENAARHLAPGGAFVLECRVPEAPGRRYPRYVNAEHLGLNEVTLEACQYDPVTQVLDKNHVTIGPGGVTFSPIRLRQAYPPEFDLMARIAGLRLRARWGGWEGEPFTAGSWRHVSVYEPAA